MSRRIIYILIGLAFVFFITSVIIFFQTKNQSKTELADPVQEDSQKLFEEPDMIKVKVFFLREDSRAMRPVLYEMPLPSFREELYRKFVNLLLIGKQNYINPIPEGVRLKAVFYYEKQKMLVIDFSSELINNFPAGTESEREFIYFMVDNLCYNFKEIKKVKFMVEGNDYKTLSGHLDFENPFFPDYSFIRDE